jgi:hypothetical protein
MGRDDDVLGFGGRTGLSKRSVVGNAANCGDGVDERGVFGDGPGCRGGWGCEPGSGGGGFAE